ncbi:hypothetical protein [Leifsonia sp. NPDC058248]|uniref:hypothetical protein n=1 Tax=Leifsonia sp. NPDC058248 TaxID=3346402 RepID=UPI0036DD7B76
MGIRTGRQALAATFTTAEPSPDTPDGPQCLRYVWLCYGAVQSNLPPLASVAFAKQGWIYSKMQHPGDRTPPAGAPVYFSGSDGHIAIATGQGDQVRSTEWPWGHVGTTTISAIEKAWGRTYYGWTGDMLGHPITFETTTAGSDGAPIAPPQAAQGETMYLIWTTNGTGWLFIPSRGFYALRTQQQYDLFKRIINSTQTAERPDTFLPAEVDIMNSILQSVPYQDIPDHVNATVDLTSLGKQLTAAVTAAVAGVATTGDTAAVAAAVSAALVPHLDAIPAAVLNAEAKRLQA